MIAKIRPGHTCQYACTVMAVILWEGLGSKDCGTRGYDQDRCDKEEEEANVPKANDSEMAESKTTQEDAASVVGTLAAPAKGKKAGKSLLAKPKASAKPLLPATCRKPLQGISISPEVITSDADALYAYISHILGRFGMSGARR